MTKGRAILYVTGIIVVFIVLVILITGCDPVTNGRANKAAHPKTTPTVSVITGSKGKVGKLCPEKKIGKKEKDPATGHIVVCKKNKKTGLPYWVG